MTKYIVHGGKPLFGEVEISGAKNAAVAIIPAAILVDGVCRIENIPQISDVTAILKILEQLGASIRSINRHTVEIDSRHITPLGPLMSFPGSSGLPTISSALCWAVSAGQRLPCPAAAISAASAPSTSM